jgi:hypothetical protein
MKLPLALVLLFSVLIASLGAASAAGRTVGDLLKDGGKQLSRADVVTLYTGATVSGTQLSRPSIKFRVVYKSDGSADGSYGGPGAYGTVSGKWSVNERGRLCSDLVNSSGGKVQGCSFLYRQGDLYFAAKTDDSAEPLVDRSFTR